MSQSDTPIPPTPNAEEYAEKVANAPDDLAWFAQSDPFALFGEWFEDAKRKEPNDANAMALATADETGFPDVRMVLLKGASEAGFSFYTNAESRKGTQLDTNPVASLCFHWKSLRRQVRISGPVVDAGEEAADAYFSSRARASQIGAWASDQSRELKDRSVLDERIAQFAEKFGAAEPPRPPHWKGYRVVPMRIEFWRDRPFRLHDRLEFTRVSVAEPWATQRLYP